MVCIQSFRKRNQKKSDERQILIYRIYYYGNRRQPYMRLPVFYALKRIAYYDISPVSYII